MNQRLENSLERIIFLLQESDGRLEYSRLIKRLISKNADMFYDTDTLLAKLKELDYIQEYSAFVQLTPTGNNFKGFHDIKYQEYLTEKEKNLNLENLELQNQVLKNQNLAESRQSEIDNLTIENLRLQNKQMKRYILYSILGFIAGGILTNIKDIINLIQQLLHK